MLLCKVMLYNFSLRLFGLGFFCYKFYFCIKCKWMMLKLLSKLVFEMVIVFEDCVYGVGSVEGYWKFISIYKDGDIVKGVCIVGEGKCLYFIGGILVFIECRKFDILEIKWENIVYMLEGRYNIYGVVFYGKIYIVGGKCYGDVYLKICEVYNVMINEW